MSPREKTRASRTRRKTDQQRLAAGAPRKRGRRGIEAAQAVPRSSRTAVHVAGLGPARDLLRGMRQSAWQAAFVRARRARSGTGKDSRRFFDPKRYPLCSSITAAAVAAARTPAWSINTTWHLVEDIERRREHLGIDAGWYSGGSWGSTLRSRMRRLIRSASRVVLRGIFLCGEKRSVVLPGRRERAVPRALGTVPRSEFLPRERSTWSRPTTVA